MERDERKGKERKRKKGVVGQIRPSECRVVWDMSRNELGKGRREARRERNELRRDIKRPERSAADAETESDQECNTGHDATHHHSHISTIRGENVHHLVANT